MVNLEGAFPPLGLRFFSGNGLIFDKGFFIGDPPTPMPRPETTFEAIENKSDSLSKFARAT